MAEIKNKNDLLAGKMFVTNKESELTNQELASSAFALTPQITSMTFACGYVIYQMLLSKTSAPIVNGITNC